jgi:Plavaka transposase
METRHHSLTTKVFTMLLIPFPLAVFLGNHTFSLTKVNALNGIPRNGWQPSTQFGIGIHNSSSTLWSEIQNLQGTLTMPLYDNSIFHRRMKTKMNLSVSTKILCLEIGHGNKRFVYVTLSYGFHSSVEKDIVAGSSPDNHGAMFVPIILGSDKTTVSVGTGNNEYWPLYGSIGNIHNNIRRAHGSGLVLIGFLAIPHGTSLLDQFLLI